MRALLIAISLLSFAGISAQGNKCGWFGTMTAEKRRALPPFSSASKIVMISFFSTDYSEEIRDDKGQIVVANDSAAVADKLGMKVLREYDISKIPNSGKTKKYAALEMAELNSIEKDSLSRWFFNYRPQNPSKGVNPASVAGYTPRNALIFLDASNKVVAYVEICFECGKYNLRPTVDWFDELTCGGKVEALKQLFRKKGIRYGIEIKKSFTASK